MASDTFQTENKVQHYIPFKEKTRHEAGFLLCAF